MSIKTNFEFPRGENPNDVIKQGQRLAQDLSKNFKSIKKNLDVIDQIQQNIPFSSFVDLVYNFPAGSPGAVNVTVAHNLGVIPTGWVIIDNTNGETTPWRASWTNSDMTLSFFGTGPTVFKVRVFI